RIAPAAERVLSLRSEGRSDGQLEGYADRPGALAVRPNLPVVHHAIGLGEREHGEAVIVHAGAEVAGPAILAVDQAAHGSPDIVAVQAKIRIFARGQKGHESQAGDSRSRLASGPVAVFRLGFHQVMEALIL